jgi:very-short-patch-repair endonuclease
MKGSVNIMNKNKILHQSPLSKGGGVAEQRENSPNCVKCDDGGFLEVHSRFLPRNKNLKLPARKLRSNATKQENHLWYDFLSKFSPRFLKQYIVNNYILDFYCHQAALAIELDGSQHYEPETLEYDNARTEYLNSVGIEVLRFSNKDINTKFYAVCKKIEAVVNERGKNPPSPHLSQSCKL